MKELRDLGTRELSLLVGRTVHCDWECEVVQQCGLLVALGLKLEHPGDSTEAVQDDSELVLGQGEMDNAESRIRLVWHELHWLHEGDRDGGKGTDGERILAQPFLDVACD